MKILFWVSLTVIIYTYFIYPVLIYLLSLFYKKHIIGKYHYPTVSVIISVYNEEGYIREKIKSLLELDYPEKRIEILIGSDGSTDATDKIASEFAGARMRLIREEIRKGKPSMLNQLVTQAKGEILVFTDARQKLDKLAIQELVKNFSDAKVGSVSSALFYENEDQSAAGLGLYWKYEKFIRHSESRMGSMLGATGALYAIRKELYPLLPCELILDDVYIPLKIIAAGYRAIFEPKAKVFDKIFKDPRTEFLRKARTLAGNYQLSVYFKELFNPLKGKISWQFFSHKFLRLVVPFLLISLFTSNLFIQELSYYIFLYAQILFYLFAFLGSIFKNKNKLLDISHMFCIMNAAAIYGLYKYLAGRQSVLWEKSQENLQGAKG